MKRVPISEAKAGFSQWIDWVKAGETVLITDRDIPVAKLESVQNHAGGEAHGRVERLLRAGIAKPPEKSLEAISKIIRRTKPERKRALREARGSAIGPNIATEGDKVA